MVGPGWFLSLVGPLGCGKTTLVRGIGRALGVKRVRSPSFTLINEYSGSPPLIHVDLYRVSSAEELVPLGLLEAFYSPKAVVVVEWAERAKELLPPRRLEVNFSFGRGDERILTFVPLDLRPSWIEALRRAIG